MKLDMTGWNDKASHNPDELRLYQEADDYITAYSRHTDLRVRRDGPALAIGGQWEEHGPLQLQFLVGHGLKRDSRLLDLGCGTGRFARHAVPWLNIGRYVGLEISEGALAHARQLSIDEGWSSSDPTFVQGDGSLLAVRRLAFDFVWAHSVFTHLPPELIDGVLHDLAGMEFGQFLFTIKLRDRPIRTGLKQFGYDFQFFIDAAAHRGLKAEALPDKWPQGQSTMRAWK